MSTNEKLVPGMVLGRYELLLPIAQGGMATVWAARQRGTRGFNKTVAIKTMLPSLTEDPQFEQMFLDEAALAAKIHHPNVAEILDLGEQDEILYIVMEWVDGEALSVIHKATRKSQGQVPMRLSMRIAQQASAALHAAHELRDENDVPLMLVHRDVSPQNILCTYDGIVKLVDFGVAKATGRSSNETSAGQLKGKVPYMSPEQARGGTVDRRTDIFAMGIVLYKLTTGLHPFLGENDLVTMRNIISRPLLPPRVKTPTFPQEVEQVLIKCLQKDPEKRYQTMAELGQAVERVLAVMGLGDDDLGTFVRGVMGDRGAKRRTAVRDAVRVADERYATGTYAAVNLQSPQTVHEGVSEIVLTQMSSTVKDELIPDRTSMASGVTAPTNLSSPPSSGQWADPPSHRTEPHGTTDGPVVVSEAIPGLRKNRAGLFVGVAAAVVTMIVGVVVLRLSAPRAQAVTMGALPPNPRAQPVTMGALPPNPQPVTMGALPPNPQPVTMGAPPPFDAIHAAAQPPAAREVVTPLPVASAVPSTVMVGAASIHSLPSAADDKSERKRAVASGPVATPTATAKPVADGDKPVTVGGHPPDPPARKVSTDKVPIFTNPGF